MFITKYNPSLVQIFDNIFENHLSEHQYHKSSSFLPSVDVIETEKIYEIQAAIPGIKKEDFKIEIDKKLLTLSGERKLEKEENTKLYKSIETKYGKFTRNFTLPENVDTDNIEANYDNGILTITIPKSDIVHTKKTVSIK